MNINPVKDRVYIEVLPFADKHEFEGTDGRKMKIHLAEKHSERTRRAKVRAVGDEAQGVLPGETVLIEWNAGSRIHLLDSGLDEDLHRIVRDHEILAVIEE